jgi:hypothetical protein
MEATHSEIYKMWMSHVKFNGWEVEEQDNSENKSTKERRAYIDELTFL